MNGTKTASDIRNGTLSEIAESLTHEQFIHSVREIAVSRLNAEDRVRLLSSKLVYGSGGGRATRGQCFFDAWHDTEASALIEVCAFGEESTIQLAGTTIHELGHFLAGPDAGHSKAWKDACRNLGLIYCLAAGQPTAHGISILTSGIVSLRCHRRRTAIQFAAEKLV